MQILLRHHYLLEISINQIDGKEQTLSLKFKLVVNFDDPVNEDAPHSVGDELLMLHILELGMVVTLTLQIVLHYLTSEYSHVLRICGIFSITFLY